MVGSVVMDGAFDFVRGVMLFLIPGDGEIEVFEDTLALFDDILELFPGFGWELGSGPLDWKFVITGECSLEPWDELG